MWHVDARRNSLITTGNSGSTPTRAALTLFYNNGKSSYTIEQRLEPGEQIWANVGEIIRNQIPDKDGKTIAPDTTMGSYELRDLDHRGVGYLYEGKLVLDKNWGHGYYGCARCCGFEIARLYPYPAFSGMIGTGGDDFAEAADCDANWDDFTSDATNWASSNTAVATMAHAYTNFVGVGSALGSSDLILESTAYHCPQKTFTPGNTVNSVNVQIAAADLEANDVSVALTGPSGTTGVLTVTANGANGSKPQVSANGGQAVGPGSYNLSFGRPAMPVDTYASVTANWSAAPSASATSNLSRKWIVLGVVRHSQYNTPAESACTGSPQTAWVFNTGCGFTQVSLKSDFVSQTYINGTGASLSHGILQYNNGALCNGKYPSGANTTNSFLAVGNVAGSCGTTLVAGDSVAMYPNPAAIGTVYNCGDDLLLVTSSNTNQALKHVADFCPSCNTGFSGTSGHIDDYSSSQSCSAHSVGDYGNFWTADRQH